MEKREKQKPVAGRQQLARRHAIGSGSTSSISSPPPPTAAVAAGMCCVALRAVPLVLLSLPLSPAGRPMFRAEADGHSALTRRLFHLCSGRPQNAPYLSPNVPSSSKDQNFSGLFSSPGGDAGPWPPWYSVRVLVIGFKGPTISLFFFSPCEKSPPFIIGSGFRQDWTQERELSMLRLCSSIGCSSYYHVLGVVLETTTALVY
jgi:hypothetical protein